MINITCDNCKKDLNFSDGFTKYALKLSCSALPHNEGYVLDVYVYPPIENDLHFCGLGCLKKYLEEKRIK